MQFYVNRLPIRFGDQGILVQQLGHEPSVVANWMGAAKAFEHLGSYYALGDELADASHPPKYLNPLDLPDQVMPYLLNAIQQLLAVQMEVQWSQGELWVMAGETCRASIRLELDLAGKCYWAVISGASQQDNMDEVEA